MTLKTPPDLPRKNIEAKTVDLDRLMKSNAATKKKAKALLSLLRDLPGNAFDLTPDRQQQGVGALLKWLEEHDYARNCEPIGFSDTWLIAARGMKFQGSPFEEDEDDDLSWLY